MKNIMVAAIFVLASLGAQAQEQVDVLQQYIDAWAIPDDSERADALTEILPKTAIFSIRRLVQRARLILVTILEYFKVSFLVPTLKSITPKGASKNLGGEILTRQKWPGESHSKGGVYCSK